MISEFIRNRISKYFTGQEQVRFKNEIPAKELISENFNKLETIGLYLHIPFCDQICPYCPYNKELYRDETGTKYISAVKKEIDFYAPLLEKKPVSSFYIGGGTPTTLLKNGIEKLIEHVYKNFNMQCHIHMETHPNHLTSENLDRIEKMGVKYLSIGVEALQDRHLKSLERSYSVKEVKSRIESAVARNFNCVNIDYIFDLPNQTAEEIEQAGKEMIQMGIQQAATYPLFRFDYTRFGKKFARNGNEIATLVRRRRYLKILEEIFYDSGFYRSSVWAFTKKGIDKYCSVTVPSYLGIGASGSSYLDNIFYVNTFRVSEYIMALLKGKSPVALSINLTQEMQMAGWLYWRIYETIFRKSDFNKRFHLDFDSKYGRQMKILKSIGYLNNGNEQITLTDRGSYWIHAFEDFFSINYINKLWGPSREDPWPEEVIL